MREVIAGTVGDFLALAAILIGVLFGLYFMAEWISDSLKLRKFKKQLQAGVNEASVEARSLALGGSVEYAVKYPRTGAEKRFLRYVYEMQKYQDELEERHAAERDPLKKGDLANEIMVVGEFLEFMEEYAFWKPKLLEKQI
jgi:hypothetical protein